MADIDLVEELLAMVERHAERNAEDIKLARTRDEHIRVTARANEAREIADKIRVITESNN
jgi:flagellar basal body rod protein FlgB